ncbi:MAG TPA: hypothetical protein VHL34_09395 [Rhizomicrobium sp.]|nr:hypothetical protein [Rhizomicrobium sp.]
MSDSEILVLAVTHSKPFQESDGVELPLEVKRSLGLDRQQSWIVTNEANFFRWPGPDVRPVRKGTLTYGQIPHALLQEVAASLVENRKQQRLKVIRRTS